MSKRYYKYSDGKTHEFDHKLRILIPSEKDRLKYLLHYCIKNYYIGHANLVANGEFIPKWKHEADLSEQFAKGFGHANEVQEVKVIINGHRYNII